jgi:hypothetical protein
VELQRSATAQEAHTALLQDQADAAERFPWDIRHMGGLDFRLVNGTKRVSTRWSLPASQRDGHPKFSAWAVVTMSSMLSTDARSSRWTCSFT